MNVQKPPAGIERQRYPRELAMSVAVEIEALLKDATERTEIVGSLRRGKKDVGDVEILFIPRMMSGVADDMFSKPKLVDQAEICIADLEKRGVIGRRLAVTGRQAGWGPLNKLAVHVRTGIPVDLFSTTAARWHMSLVIRTGPKEFNLALIKGALDRGLNLHAYGVYTYNSTGEEVPCNSEQEVLQLAGIPWIEPKDRR